MNVCMTFLMYVRLKIPMYVFESTELQVCHQKLSKIARSGHTGGQSYICCSAVDHLFKLDHSLTHFFVLSIQPTGNKMTGFEPPISGVRSYRSTY